MAWAPDYVTDDELKAYLRIGDDVDDDQIALAIAAAARQAAAVTTVRRTDFDWVPIAPGVWRTITAV
jgi:hypothetical protein